MTGPLQPSTCTRCGQPVLPDPQTAGFWVDQQNGRYCGGNPQFPHLAQAAPGTPQGQPPGAPPGQAPFGQQPYGQPFGQSYGQPFGQQPFGAPPQPKKSGTVWWVAGGVALLAIAVVVTLVLVLPGDSDEQNTAQGGPAPAPPPTSSSPAPEPGASVPCDPDAEYGMRCYPPEVDGSAFIKRLGKAQGWQCNRKGEKDEYGDDVDRIEECNARNNVDQPYAKSISIGYDTDNFEPTGTMNEVYISASTSAREYKGESVDNRLTGELADTAFGIAIDNLWHDKKQLRQSFEAAYRKIRDACASETATPPTAKHELGYEISCSPGSAISINGDKGTVTTITESIRITAEQPDG